MGMCVSTVQTVVMCCPDFNINLQVDVSLHLSQVFQTYDILKIGLQETECVF